VPASEKDPEGWTATGKFTVFLVTTCLHATELSDYCLERGLFTEQVERWRQASQDANEKPVLTLIEQKELEKLRAQDQREIKRRKQELRRKEKALAEAVALLMAANKIRALMKAWRRCLRAIVGPASGRGSDHAAALAPSVRR